MSLTWPCQYNGCKNRISEIGNKKTNQKYCKPHRKIRDAERRLEVNELKKKQRRENKKKLKCCECGSNLPLWKKLYCSIECSDISMKKKRKYDRLYLSLKYHENKVKEIKEMLIHDTV